MYQDQSVGAPTNINTGNGGFKRIYVSSGNNTELFKMETSIAVTSSTAITSASM